MKCDAGIHEETYTYVVLSGETTMFQGIGERMPNELAKVLGMGWRSEPISFSAARAGTGTPLGHFHAIPF